MGGRPPNRTHTQTHTHTHLYRQTPDQPPQRPLCYDGASPKVKVKSKYACICVYMCICAYMHAFTYVYKTKTQLSHVSGRGLPPTHMPHPLAPTLPLTCPPHPTAHAPTRSPLKQTPPGPPQVDPAPSHPQPSAGRLGNPATVRKRRTFSSLWDCSSITFEPVTAHAPITRPG